MNEHPLRLRAPFLKRNQIRTLFEALDALIGNKPNGEALTWATDAEKQQLLAVRKKLAKFYTPDEL